MKRHTTIAPSLSSSEPALRAEQSNPSARAAWILLLIVLAGVMAIRLHRLDLPIERDEGEYGYGARLILDGDFSYDSLRTLKLPGVHLALTPFLLIFGDTPTALRTALLCFDVASVIALYFLARSFLSAWRAALVAATLAMAQLSFTVLGLFAHAENFALFFVLFGLFFAVRAARGARVREWFWSGILLGIALLMKQHAIVFGVLALGGALIASRESGGRALARRGAWFMAAWGTPFAALCVWMAAIGHFEAFWFTTVTYARAYTSGATWHQGLLHLQLQLESVSRYQGASAILASIGIVAIFARSALRPLAALWSGLAIAGLISAAVGLYFRAHYFVLLLPAWSFALVFGAETVTSWVARSNAIRVRVAAALVLVVGVIGIVLEHETAWTADAQTVSQRLYYPNPFAAGAEIAELIRAHSQPDDTIAVLGSEPEIAFLSGRRSATGFVYMYPLLEEHEYATWMQERAIEEIEAKKPRIFVSVNVSVSWLRRPKSVTRILEWMPEYARRHYKIVAVLDLDSVDGSSWHDAEEVSRATRAPTYAVLVLERIAGS